MLVSGPAIFLGMFMLLLCLIPNLVAAFGMPEFLEFGTCSEFEAPHLDAFKYSGIWFTQEMVPNEYTKVEQCAQTNYTWYDDVMTIVERGLSADGQKLKKQTLMYPDEEEPNLYYVDSPGVPTAPYTIVETDYTGYACTYSCMEFMGFKAEFTWVFTRKAVADPLHIKACHDVFSREYMPVDGLEPVRQGDSCPYWHKVDKLNAYNKYIQDMAAKRSPAVSSTTTTTTTTTTTHRPHRPITSRTTVSPPVAPTTPQISSKTENELQHLDELHTIIDKEEKLLVEIESEIHDEEEELLHLIEKEQDIREKNYRINRKNAKHGHRTSTSTSAPPRVEEVSSSAVTFSSSAIVAAVPSLLVFLRTALI